MLEIILDSLKDSARAFPFILLIYILMEVIESAKSKERIEKALAGPLAPVVAGTLGIIPECGFAVAISKLFDKGLITIGTVIAAFIAMSDEGLIVLISHGKIVDGLILVGIKIVYAIIIGEVVNLFFKSQNEHHICPEKGDCIECGEHHEKFWDKFLLHPLLHAFITFLYIFGFSVFFSMVINVIGEEEINAFLDKSVYLQPLIASLVGLIPNCASSTLIASAYVNGVLNFSGLIAGLSANAGMGIIVLFKNGKKTFRNLLILLIMFTSGLIIGYLSLIFVL